MYFFIFVTWTLKYPLVLFLPITFLKDLERVSCGESHRGCLYTCRLLSACSWSWFKVEVGWPSPSSCGKSSMCKLMYIFIYVYIYILDICTWTNVYMHIYICIHIFSHVFSNIILQHIWGWIFITTSRKGALNRFFKSNFPGCWKVTVHPDYLHILYIHIKVLYILYTYIYICMYIYMYMYVWYTIHIEELHVISANSCLLPAHQSCWNIHHDCTCHRENGSILGMIPLINPIYTWYSGYLLGISPFLKGFLFWGEMLNS